MQPGNASALGAESREFESLYLDQYMSHDFIERKDLFPTPVWRYKFTDYDQHKESILNYLFRDDIYFSQYERKGVQASEVKLFDVKELEPLRDFLYGCLKDVMVKLGYEPNIGMTSMWANRYKKGGHIHQHFHTNCYLAAVFYAFDGNNQASGTYFHNTGYNQNVIRPRAIDGAREFFVPGELTSFEVGTCTVFPSWAVHSTFPSESNYRIVVATDAMPIGRTNTSHYEQYVYPDPKDFGILDLEQDVHENGYLKIKKS